MIPEKGKIYIIDFTDGVEGIEDSQFKGIAVCTGAMMYTDQILYGFNHLVDGKVELKKNVEENDLDDVLNTWEEEFKDVWFHEKYIKKEFDSQTAEETLKELKEGEIKIEQLL